jgi:hypothetical protein
MRRRILCAALMVPLAVHGLSATCPGQLLHQEGFNDDGDGTRYTLFGRGAAVTAEGPGMWEHNFLVDQIGLVGTAPARRAAILWGHDWNFGEDFQPEAYQVWTNLANWAMEGKQNATIGFFPGHGSTNPQFDSVIDLAQMFQDQGHSVVEIPDVPTLQTTELDLFIHTSEALPPNPTDFAALDVPAIFFNAPNHDDSLVAQIGVNYTFQEALTLDVVAENASHPVLQGLSNQVPWTNDFAVGVTMHGMGNAPPGGDVLLTFEDPANPGTTQNALIVIDEGDGLLGSFTPQPEGSGFIVGASLNKFGDMLTRALELNPVDISGHDDVMLTASLAATNADFEVDDFLRVMVGQSGDPVENFITLADYVGVDAPGSPTNKGLSADGGATALSPLEFMDVTWNVSELAPGITDLVVRFETLNTFPNEIVGIDNIRIFAGEIGGGDDLPGDYSGNGLVEQADLDLVLGNWGADAGSVPATWVNDPPVGFVDQAELDKVLGNWGSMAPGLGAAGAVPEPHTWGLLVVLAATIALRRRVG